MSRPPGPPGWPLVGHLPGFLNDKLGFLTRCVEQYGDIVSLHIGEPTLLLNNPADIQHVLIDNSANYSKTWRLTGAGGKRMAGNGLHTSNGATHLRQRRLLQPVFAWRSIASFLDVMLDRTKRRMAAWTLSAARGGEISLAAETESLAVGIILGSVFGSGFADEKLESAIAARRRYIEYMYGSVLPLREHLPLPVVREYRRAQSAIDLVIKRESEGPRDPQSFAALFAALEYADGSGMDFSSRRDEILTMLSTGYETLGDALGWTLYLLAQHAAVESAVLAELKAVLGDRDPGVDDLGKLTYTRQVIDESMRLYPPTWLIVRMAAESDTLPSGADVLPGSKLYLCQYVTQRCAKYFPDPLRIDPERFRVGGEGCQRPRFSYFPFGGGTRQCIGEHFALMELVTVLALVLPRFRFEISPDEAIAPRPTITLRPKNGLRGRIVQRK